MDERLSRVDAAELAKRLAAVPWCPPGLSADDDSPQARASALLTWARANPGHEARAIEAALLTMESAVGQHGLQLE